MKKIDIKAFWFILSGIIGALVYNVMDLFLSRNRVFPALEERIDAERLEKLSVALFRFGVIATVVFTLVCVYFIFRLIKNRKESQGQTYIKFLFVLNIVFAILHVISLLSGNFIALVSIVLNALVLIGCSIQKNYEYREIT